MCVCFQLNASKSTCVFYWMCGLRLQPSLSRLELNLQMQSNLILYSCCYLWDREHTEWKTKVYMACSHVRLMSLISHVSVTVPVYWPRHSPAKLKWGSHFGVLTGMWIFQNITLHRATNSAKSQAKIRLAVQFVERNNFNSLFSTNPLVHREKNHRRLLSMRLFCSDGHFKLIVSLRGWTPSRHAINLNQ